MSDLAATATNLLTRTTTVKDGIALGPEVRILCQPDQGNYTPPPRMTRLLFHGVIALGAFLLFSVQLLIGKYILPWFGGTAGVWTACLLFFQTTLLAGYWYAHTSVSRLSPPVQAKLHVMLVLVSLAMMSGAAFFWPSPITPGPSWKPQSGNIAVWLILRVLMVSVGASVSLLATTGPLMQHWFTLVYPGKSPYRLYALSNFGSLMGLLSYPLVLEPLLKLRMQAWLWCAAYVAYAVAAIVCARSVARSNAETQAIAQRATAEDGTATRPGRQDKVLWFFLAAMGSLLLLATTHFITQDLAPIPLLWTLPLAVYLISFILCFDHARWYRPSLFHLLLWATTLLIIVIYYSGAGLRLWMFIGAFLLVFFAGCVLCHGELYRRRPSPMYLTSFYLMIALGGVAGSAFVNLLAPLLFQGYWEMEFGLAACLLTMAVMAIRDQTSWAHRNNPFVAAALLACTLLTLVLWLNKPHMLIHFRSDWRLWTLSLVALGCTLLAFASWNHAGRKIAVYAPLLTRWCLLASVVAAGVVLVMEGTAQYRFSNWAHRNFYGVLYVEHRSPPDARLSFYALRHNSTQHGVQMIAPEMRRYPTSYYSQTSGVGLMLLNYPGHQVKTASFRPLRVGVIGLGVGVIAAYGLPGDVFRFYEIDPEVIRVARGQGGFFSFVHDSPAQVEIVEGDARIQLERELASGRPQGYDILAIDAFSGDTVPTHLLTSEAFQLYLKHLRDENSVIAFHVSNRSVDLSSVIGAQAERFRLHTAFINGPGFSDPVVQELVAANWWILLSRNPDMLSLPAIAQVSRPLPLRRGLHLWTDDRNNLLEILK
jgi:hypothetical protein